MRPPPEPIVPEEFALALDKWADLLAESGWAWRESVASVRAGPQPGSPAWNEDARLAELHPEWPQGGAWECALVAGTLIGASSDLLMGLRALVLDRQLLLSPWPVLRAMVEHLARAVWILDPEPPFLESRPARCWLEKLHAVHQSKWALSAMRASKPEQSQARAARNDLLARARTLFPSAALDPWERAEEPVPWEIEGERYPSITAACKRFLVVAGITGGHGLYDLLASASHPNVSELALITRWAGETGKGKGNAIYVGNPETVVRMLGWGVGTFCTAASIFCNYVGASSESVDDLLDQVLRLTAPQLRE